MGFSVTDGHPSHCRRFLHTVRMLLILDSLWVHCSHVHLDDIEFVVDTGNLCVCYSHVHLDDVESLWML